MREDRLAIPDLDAVETMSDELSTFADRRSTHRCAQGYVRWSGGSEREDAEGRSKQRQCSSNGTWSPVPHIAYIDASAG